MRYAAFHPGQVWLDIEGERIQAHGGSMMYLNGTYYWYGENKEKTTGKDKIWHWGVRCYTSKDLYNWEDKGLIIEPRPEEPDSSLHPEDESRTSYHSQISSVFKVEGKKDLYIAVADRWGRRRWMCLMRHMQNSSILFLTKSSIVRKKRKS